MQALVNNGVSMSSKDSRGSTPAHLAAAHGNSFTLNTILRAGIVSISLQSIMNIHSNALIL